MIPNESMTSDIVNCFSFIVPPPPQEHQGEVICWRKRLQVLCPPCSDELPPFSLLLVASWELVYSDKGT